MESLLRNKDVLQAMADEEGCCVWARKRPTQEKKLAAALMIKTIQDGSFWRRVREVKDLLEPIMLTLRKFDTYEARTGDVVNDMRKLRDALSKVKLHYLFTPSLTEVGEAMSVMEPDEARDKILAMFDCRWKEFQSFCHIAGFLLNPRTVIHRGELQVEIAKSRSAFTAFVRKSRAEDALQLITDMNLWLSGRGPLCLTEELELCAARTLAPHVYWETVGNTGERALPALCQLALRVLSQVTTQILLDAFYSQLFTAVCVCWHERVELVLLPGRAQQEAQPTVTRAY